MNCKIIQDLLPLYCDGVCSEESRTWIDEHLRTCSDCREALRWMQEPQEPTEAELTLAGSAHKLWQRGTHRAFRRGLLLTLAILLAAGLAIFGIFLTRHYSNSCAQDNAHALLSVMTCEGDAELDEIAYSARKGDYLAVAARDTNGLWSVGIFQPDSVFSDRWVYQGGMLRVRPGSLASWNWNVDGIGTVLVCFGAELPDSIVGYTFTNSGITYTCPVANGMVLDFFFAPDTYDESTLLRPILQE